MHLVSELRVGFYAAKPEWESKKIGKYCYFTKINKIQNLLCTFSLFLISPIFFLLSNACSHNHLKWLKIRIKSLHFKSKTRERNTTHLHLLLVKFKQY